MPKESKVITPKAGKSTDSVVYITSTLIPDSISTLDLFKHMYGKESTSFWLDSASKVQYSADVNKKQLSFMGAMDSTSHVIEYLGNNELLLRHANGSTIAYDSNIFKYLHDNINLAVPPRVVVDDCIPTQGRYLPFSILEAWFGYIGYEGRFDAEAIFASASSGDVCAYDYSSPADVGSVERLASLTQPVALLLHPAVYLVFDHDDSRLYTVSRASDDETARVQAEEVMRKVRELVEGTRIAEHDLSELLSDPSPSSMLTASRSESDYRADIARCLEEIRQGETYEVCLTVQFRGRSPPSRDPLDVYEVLRARNPAPYASFIRYNPQLLAGDPSLRWYSNGGLAIMSSSPERYLKSNLVSVRSLTLIVTDILE
jgi:para-aminobenzoate synthetase